MALSYPSGFNTFVPKATGQVISWIRQPERFKLNQYIQYISGPKIGVYYIIDRDEPVRGVSLETDIWHDGSNRPVNERDALRHRAVEYACVRHNDSFTIGWQALDLADYPILVQHSGATVSRHMTKRTARVISKLETTGNWSGNTGTANTLNSGAGKWDTASSDPSDPNFLAIKKTIDAVVNAIELATNGLATTAEDYELLMVISPNAARKMSATSEIHDYLAQSPFALAQVRGNAPGQNKRYGLPDELYGVKVVVENTPRVFEHPKADGTLASTSGGLSAPRRYAKSDDSAIFVSRPGGLDGQYGAPSFSTMQLYHYEGEMQIETFDDAEQHLTRGHVASDIAEVLAAPESGYLVTDILT